MQANELRIGNLLEKKGSPISVTVEVLQKISDIRSAAGYKPIPLTEEWLLNFGFGKSVEHECGHNKHAIFGFYYNYHFNLFTLEADNSNIEMPIKYVHQLQNLYYALTGEELVLKETFNSNLFVIIKNYHE